MEGKLGVESSVKIRLTKSGQQVTYLQFATTKLQKKLAKHGIYKKELDAIINKLKVNVELKVTKNSASTF